MIAKLLKQLDECNVSDMQFREKGKVWETPHRLGFIPNLCDNEHIDHAVLEKISELCSKAYYEVLASDGFRQLAKDTLFKHLTEEKQKLVDEATEIYYLEKPNTLVGCKEATMLNIRYIWDKDSDAQEVIGVLKTLNPYITDKNVVNVLDDLNSYPCTISNETYKLVVGMYPDDSHKFEIM